MPSTVFDIEWELVKLEIETINSTVRQMDEISKDVKQWTVVLWTAATGGALAAPPLRGYVIFTAAIPLLFWLVDASYRQVQRRFIWRSEHLGKFFRGNGLAGAVTAGRLGRSLALWDPAAVYTGDEDYKSFINIGKIMRFPSVFQLYVGLAAVSGVLGVLAWIIRLDA